MENCIYMTFSFFCEVAWPSGENKGIRIRISLNFGFPAYQLYGQVVIYGYMVKYGHLTSLTLSLLICKNEW